MEGIGSAGLPDEVFAGGVGGGVVGESEVESLGGDAEGESPEEEVGAPKGPGERGLEEEEGGEESDGEDEGSADLLGALDVDEADDDEHGAGEDGQNFEREMGQEKRRGDDLEPEEEEEVGADPQDLGDEEGKEVPVLDDGGKDGVVLLVLGPTRVVVGEGEDEELAEDEDLHYRYHDGRCSHLDTAAAAVPLGLLRLLRGQTDVGLGLEGGGSWLRTGGVQLGGRGRDDGRHAGCSTTAAPPDESSAGPTAPSSHHRVRQLQRWDSYRVQINSQL